MLRIDASRLLLSLFCAAEIYLIFQGSSWRLSAISLFPDTAIHRYPDTDIS